MGHGDGRQRAGRTRTKDVDVPDARAAQSGRLGQDEAVQVGAACFA